MIRPHSLKSLIHSPRTSSRPILSTSSSGLNSQRGVHIVRYNGGQQQQQILWPSSAFGVRQFSSSAPEMDDDSGIETNQTSADSSNEPGWDENDFSHLIQRKYDSSTVESLLSDAAANTTAAVPSWEPCYYDPADLVIESIRLLHETSGLEYAWCLVGFVTLVRLGLFPCQVLAQRNNSRIAHIGMIRKQISVNLDLQNNQAHRARLAEETKALLEKYRVKRIYSVLPQLSTVPFAFAFYVGFTKMCTVFHDDLATGGLLWFPDLTVPDPYYILPIVNAATYLGVTEYVRNQTYDPFSPTNSTKTYFRRGLALLFIPCGAVIPSALVLSWETFYLISFGHSLLFDNASVKKFFGIMDVPEQAFGGGSVASGNDATGKATEGGKGKRPMRRGGRRR